MPKKVDSAFVLEDYVPEIDKLPTRIKAVGLSLEKKFSFGSGNCLLQVMELATLLYAIENIDASCKILSFVEENVAFTGDHNIWTPVGYSICLLIRICRLRGDFEQVERLIPRIVENPFCVPFPILSKFNLTRVRTMEIILNNAYEKTSDKLACNLMSNALSNGFYHYEFGLHLGLDLDESRNVHMQRLDENISSGLRLLKSRLEKTGSVAKTD